MNEYNKTNRTTNNDDFAVRILLPYFVIIFSLPIFIILLFIYVNKNSVIFYLNYTSSFQHFIKT